MKVLICWSRISGYMTACWKRLSAHPGIDLRVLAWETSTGNDQSAFEGSIADGLNCRLLSPDERDDVRLIENEITEFAPDVIVVPGWISPAYTATILKLREISPTIVMGMDTPWQGNMRQHLTRWRYHSLFRRIDRVVVAGERAWQYARRLGFAEARISRGVYAWDETSFGTSPRLFNETTAAAKRFIFVGRLAQEKGIGTLTEGYRQYRKSVSAPWPLTVCGTGPLSVKVHGPGIEHRGFVQPAELPTILSESSVFVLPSHYEPWGVAMAEAMGAGLPVIASEACGASVDLIRPYWNGLGIPTGSASGLSDALRWFHNHPDRLAEMGANAQKAAEPFSSTNWAIRWMELLKSTTPRSIDQRKAA